MQARGIFFGSFAAMAMSFVWLACSGSTKTDCVLGAETCACTSGGACDDGLTCISERCMRLDAGSSATGGSSASTGTTSSSSAATTSTTTSAGASGSGGGSVTATGVGGAAGIGGSATSGSGGARDAAADVATPTTGSGGAGGAPGGAAGSSGSAGSGIGGSGGFDAGQPSSTKLGASCKADGDCGAGFTCIKSSDALGAGRGGVGNGLCTVDCSIDPMVCAPLGGTCVVVDASGSAINAKCFESCSIGPNPPAPPVTKCHGRADVACEPLNPAETIFGCVPLCVTDADCGSRKCDMATGLCVDTPKTGKSAGAGCTAVTGQSSAECAGGLCLAIDSPAPDGGPTRGICSAQCRLGTQDACGYRATPIDAGPPMGACVLPFGETGYNSGDLGLCLQLCDSPSDCSYQGPNWTCRTDITLRGFGHSVCLLPLPG